MTMAEGQRGRREEVGLVERAGLPPGPRGVEGIWRRFGMRWSILRTMLDLHRRYGDVVQLGSEQRPLIGVFGHEAAEELLLTRNSAFRKAGIAGPFAELSGRGILTTHDQEHGRQRKTVLRAFASDCLARYQELMREGTEDALDAWRPGARIEVTKEASELGKRAALRFLFGFARKTTIPAAFVEALDHLSFRLDGPTSRLDLVLRSPIQVEPWLDGRSLWRDRLRIEQELRTILEDASRGSVGTELLARGREMGGEWGPVDVVPNLIQLYMTSYDTTSCALSWAVYLLARHPEARGKVLTELLDVVGDADPTYADLARLPYLEAVVRETLRLYPTGPYASREALEDTTIGGCRVGRGDFLIYSPWVTHRGRVYDAPERFVPERFLGGSSFPRAAYMPFGLGDRSCVAGNLATMQIKTALAMILRRVDIELEPRQRIRAVSVNAVHLKPGLFVRLHRRGAAPKQPVAIDYRD